MEMNVEHMMVENGEDIALGMTGVGLHYISEHSLRIGFAEQRKTN